MKISIITYTLAVLVGVAPSTIWAKSHVYNATKTEITAYWKAAGCAGAKSTPSCEQVQKNVLTVCKKKVLAPGESSDYGFKDGTSNRQVIVFQCYNNGENSDSNTANTGNKGGKKRCAVFGKGSEPVKVKCGYSQEEYDALKAN